MKKKKETKESSPKKKSVKETKSVKESASVKRTESGGPEGSFVCPHTGETILKKNCIIDRQKAKTVYFYGTANDSGYNKVYIEKHTDEKK